MPTTTLTLVLSSALLFLVGMLAWTGHRRRIQIQDFRVATSALRAAEQRMESLSEHLPVALFQYEVGHQPDSAGRFVYVSEGIGRLLPVSAEQLMEHPQALLHQLDDQTGAGLDWLKQSQSTCAQVAWTGRVLANAPDGAERWLKIIATAGIGIAGQRILNGVITDVTDMKLIENALQTSRAELRSLAAHRTDQSENEYRRLAREFHDDLGQVLTGARLRLQLIPRAAASDTDLALAEIDGMIVEAYRSVKSIAAELRPPALNLGLAAAIEWQAERTLAPAGIGFTCAIRYPTEDLDETVATSLFRIVQEAFTNVIRYARASSVHVSLRVDDAQLLLEIGDDGVGFLPDKVDGLTHFGLTGMRERTIALGGTLEIDSFPGEGARVHVRIPVPTQDADS